MNDASNRMAALARTHLEDIKRTPFEIDTAPVLKDTKHLQAWICHATRRITLNGHHLADARNRDERTLFLVAHEFFHALCLQYKVTPAPNSPQEEEIWADQFAHATVSCSKF